MLNAFKINIKSYGTILEATTPVKLYEYITRSTISLEYNKCMITSIPMVTSISCSTNSSTTILNSSQNRFGCIWTIEFVHENSAIREFLRLTS